MRIDVAVPTYNCARWLDAFMESMLAQDFQGWRIITRDDGSQDNTIELVAAWKERLGERMSVIPNLSKVNMGAVRSYDVLLAATTSPKVMMGDPDDIWLPNKISLTVKAMEEAESMKGVDIPIIISTDAKMVDDNLKEIAGSFWLWSKYNPKYVTSFPRMLVEHPGLCATMMVNRSALDMALPFSGALCQDWWLILVGCAFGYVKLLPEKTILYRRHDANDSQIPLSVNFSKSVLQGIPFLHYRTNLILSQASKQAEVFLERFGDGLSSRNVAALEAVSKLQKLAPLSRRIAVVRNHLWFSSYIKNIGMMVFL